MKNFVVELLLPRTDAGVAVQWLVMVPFWALTVWRTWRFDHEVRLLVWGLGTVNLAWFLIRMAH